MLGFVTRNNMIDFDEHYDNDCFCMKKSFDNKYKFVKGDDDYYYTTMFIPFTQILEPASRMSLLRIYAAEFDIIFKDSSTDIILYSGDSKSCKLPVTKYIILFKCYSITIVFYKSNCFYFSISFW